MAAEGSRCLAHFRRTLEERVYQLEAIARLSSLVNSTGRLAWWLAISYGGIGQ